MKRKNEKVQWISPREAIQNAVVSLDRPEIKNFPNSIRKPIVGKPFTPFFVKYLHNKSAYFLVPWKHNEKVAFIIQINARTGQFAGITFFEKMQRDPIIPEASASNCATAAYPTENFVSKGLVWKPCRESTTPLRPFYLFESENLSIFVDMNCKIFTFLTPLGKGG